MSPRLYLHFVGTAIHLAFAAWKDGRLSASPRRWLIDLRHLYGLLRERNQTPTTPDPVAGASRSSRESYAETCRAALSAFLEGNGSLALPASETPRLSILIVVFNRAEFTLRCLESIARHAPSPFEVVLLDNGSTDATTEMLKRVRGIRVERLDANAGFLTGANLAARAARGDLLLFLNNDVELLPGAIESAMATIEAAEDIGAVGGRLIFPDGRLQEAGSIIWRDGSCQGYGRGGSPDASDCLFVRDVDFVSGAFLLTRRMLFEDLGGFDSAFAPAYYEDVDYCVRLWKRGHRVVYDPRAAVRHFEFASSSPDAAVALQQTNRRVFVNRHSDWLAGQHEAAVRDILRARARPPRGERILLFDDRVPRRDLGFGFPRAADLVGALVDDGHFVTVYPTDPSRSDRNALHADVPPVVEIATDGPHHIARFMEVRRGYYDAIIVSRAHNMELVRSKLGPPAQWSPGARVVYDAEAVAALREIGRRRVLGEAVPAETARRMVEAELDLARGADAVLAVSEMERSLFESGGITPVHVVSHTYAVCPTPRPFEQRTGLLFVGSFDELSPNEDAVRWFARDVLPLIRDRIDENVRLTVVGRHAPPSLSALGPYGVDVLGSVDDLLPLYDRARVFVAPSRFAAGIPYKVGHAATHGVPVVCTPLLQEQLGWQNGVEVLSAEDPADFAAVCAELYLNERRWTAVRTAALTRVAREYDATMFRSNLRAAVASGRTVALSS